MSTSQPSYSEESKSEVVAKDVELVPADDAAALKDVELAAPAKVDAVDDAPPPLTAAERAQKFYWQNSFVCNVIVVICIARAHEAVTTRAYIDVLKYVSIVAVMVIFFFTGLSLRTRELVKALAHWRFNLFVQGFNLGLLPLAIWAFSRLLFQVGFLPRELANGIVVCAALPMTVNMVIVLTKSSGGDEAAAVFNSAFGNLLGVFVTPAWLLYLLHEESSVSFADAVLKIAIRILLPLSVGQFAQYNLPKVAAWAKKHKPRIKKCQEHALTYIVYASFVDTFHSFDPSLANVLKMVLVQCGLLFSSMVVAWFALGAARFGPKQRVMGLFGCTHKTVAMGVPLIGAIYPGRGLYLLPLLVWHPTQLIVGSMLAPRLSAWVDRQLEGVAVS
eukprot:CAMPEP_0119264154 /NCGR_PEP_ID=MMETSP1329-20130426/3317_1 /TAXON_ID=114041 /ORGANISM="Genus nov. species nov., Strain RCC1024" /LENGTH=388 /DNA_ID=CAMNT_0007263899 /DNA_START=170 /DNA_END=1332 /DNA_ORIENTATION=-